MTDRRTPVVSRWLLQLSIGSAERRENVLGDLEEEFLENIVPNRGLAQARWWYRGQALTSGANFLNQRVASANPLRLIAGLMLGWVALMITTFAAWQLLQAPLAERALGEPLGPAIVIIAVGGSAMVGGYITVRVSRRKDVRDAVLLGAATAGIAFLLMSRSPEPEAPSAFLAWGVFAPLAAILGGRIGLVRAKRQRHARSPG